MPADLARSATSSPTRLALAVLSSEDERRSASMVDADASVLPTRSATTWTVMCFDERVTTRRGRSVVPLTFLRTRKWRRARPTARLAATASGAPAATDAGPADPAATGDAPTDMFKATEGRWGTREVEIPGVTLLGGDGQPGHVFQYGEAVRVQMNVRAHHALKDFVFGFGIFNADGVCCYGTNTNLEELQPDEISGEGVVTFEIDSLKLVEGTYRLDLAAHKLDGYQYDYHRLLYSFRVNSRTKDVEIYRPDHRWTFSPAIRPRPPRRPRRRRRRRRAVFDSPVWGSVAFVSPAAGCP